MSIFYIDCLNHKLLSVNNNLLKAKSKLDKLEKQKSNLLKNIGIHKNNLEIIQKEYPNVILDKDGYFVLDSSHWHLVKKLDCKSISGPIFNQHIFMLSGYFMVKKIKIYVSPIGNNKYFEYGYTGNGTRIGTSNSSYVKEVMIKHNFSQITLNDVLKKDLIKQLGQQILGIQNNLKNYNTDLIINKNSQLYDELTAVLLMS